MRNTEQKYRLRAHYDTANIECVIVNTINSTSAIHSINLKHETKLLDWQWRHRTQTTQTK